MKQNTLEELVEIVLMEMKKSGFRDNTIGNHTRIFSRILLLAKQRQEKYYSRELGEAFISDNLSVNSGEYSHTRSCLHSRCVYFIEAYLEKGKVDWTPHYRRKKYALKSSDLMAKYNEFMSTMKLKGLKENTRDGYGRLVYYFLSYLEDKGYANLLELKQGDVVSFIVLVCKEHYNPTSLGGHLSGLKLFLNMQEDTVSFVVELPEHLPRKRDILEVYSKEEYDEIHYFLENGDLSLRNKAISLIAFETGLRSIDICNLTLSSIDWNRDCFKITQQKTGRPLLLPLSKAVGNALVEYMLNERPHSDSPYVFLCEDAPFNPIRTHTACRYILRNIVIDAGIIVNGRVSGTRITRHSTASRMLLHGIPLPVISNLLGHANQDSVMIYLATNDAIMAKCTLPLPKKEAHHED